MNFLEKVFLKPPTWILVAMVLLLGFLAGFAYSTIIMYALAIIFDVAFSLENIVAVYIIVLLVKPVDSKKTIKIDKK